MGNRSSSNAQKEERHIIAPLGGKWTNIEQRFGGDFLISAQTKEKHFSTVPLLLFSKQKLYIYFFAQNG
jgi:hypothetical protein